MMSKPLLTISIPGTELGMLYQAWNEVADSEEGKSLTFYYRFILRVEISTEDRQKCNVSFCPRDDSSMNEATYLPLVTKVITRLGALVEQENNKPIFRFRGYSARLHGITREITTSFGNYLSVKIDTKGAVGDIFVYKKSGNTNELISEICWIIDSAYRSKT